MSRSQEFEVQSPLSARARERDFSDVVKQVGGASVNNGGNRSEIHVDPTNDPDIGEILMVKKSHRGEKGGSLKAKVDEIKSGEVSRTEGRTTRRRTRRTSIVSM